MACGCTSNSSPSYGATVTSSGGCSTAVSAGAVCPIPRRVASPPTTPVIWTGADRLLQASSAKLMGTRCNGEVVNIDSPVDGTWMFDAATGNSYVGSPVISYVEDAYACAQTQVYGYPAYGAAPGCRPDGQNPDRQIAFIRPVPSPAGSLFAHTRSCCNVPGAAPEMTPVEIAPGLMPSPVPENLRYLAFTVTDSTACSPSTYQWYAGTGVPVVGNDNLLAYASLPARAWTGSDDSVFGLGVWVKQSNGTWILERVSNASFQNYINQFSYRTRYLGTRAIIANQESPSSSSQTFVFDLTTLPDYSAQATEVQLYFETNMVSPNPGGEGWSFQILINGVRKHFTAGGPESTGTLVSSEVHVPIPSNKLLSIDYVKTVLFAGTNYGFNASKATVFLEAFK